MCPQAAVVACEVMRREFEAVIGGRDLPLYLADYALHSRPQEMAGRVMEKILLAQAQGAEHILLGYGRCSNGVLGVRAEGGLTMPRCHDCIAMLLGSPKRYHNIFYRYPGAYFLSAGWVEVYGDPLSTVEKKYAPRLGDKKALRGMQLELANYKYIIYINNGVGDAAALKERALENCRVFEKEYLEIEAGLEYFSALVDGPRRKGHFINLPPGQELQDTDFEYW
jgi:hypothetical protein